MGFNKIQGRIASPKSSVTPRGNVLPGTQSSHGGFCAQNLCPPFDSNLCLISCSLCQSRSDFHTSRLSHPLIIPIIFANAASERLISISTNSLSRVAHLRRLQICTSRAYRLRINSLRSRTSRGETLDPNVMMAG